MTVNNDPFDINYEVLLAENGASRILKKLYYEEKKLAYTRNKATRKQEIKTPKRMAKGQQEKRQRLEKGKAEQSVVCHTTKKRKVDDLDEDMRIELERARDKGCSGKVPEQEKGHLGDTSTTRQMRQKRPRMETESDLIEDAPILDGTVIQLEGNGYTSTSSQTGPDMTEGAETEPTSDKLKKVGDLSATILAELS
ncbi:hypothetical protein BDQ17DRAFT_1426041 [Cyathus striatus]|nr:hypothetical protein BDQ17DRAFT_1426041 [Cyathus striatus]